MKALTNWSDYARVRGGDGPLEKNPDQFKELFESFRGRYPADGKHVVYYFLSKAQAKAQIDSQIDEDSYTTEPDPSDSHLCTTRSNPVQDDLHWCAVRSNPPPESWVPGEEESETDDRFSAYDVKLEQGCIMVDTGCLAPVSVGGEEWHRELQTHMRALGKDFEQIENKEGYQFGPGVPIRSTIKWRYEVGILRIPYTLEIAQIEQVCPGLVGFNELKEWGCILDLGESTVSISKGEGEEKQSQRGKLTETSTGHPQISLLDFPEVFVAYTVEDEVHSSAESQTEDKDEVLLVMLIPVSLLVLLLMSLQSPITTYLLAIIISTSWLLVVLAILLAILSALVTDERCSFMLSRVLLTTSMQTLMVILVLLEKPRSMMMLILLVLLQTILVSLWVLLLVDLLEPMISMITRSSFLSVMYILRVGGTARVCYCGHSQL